MNENIKTFCNTIRSRSLENKIAIELLNSNQLYSNAMSILRQELDLMVRVIFLSGIQDEPYRNELIERFIKGEKWKNQKHNTYITDRQMVEYANKLFGYARLVYRFGCSFIHLSNLQNWLNEDVAHHLDTNVRNDIVRYINQYHNTGLKADFTFDDIIPFIPAIFKKINENLDYYVKQIENGSWNNIS